MEAMISVPCLIGAFRCRNTPVLPGEKNCFSNRKTSMIWFGDRITKNIMGVLTILKKTTNKKYSPFKIQVSISYSIRSKVSAERNIWQVEKRYRKNTEKALRAKGSRNIGGRDVYRPYTYVGKYTTTYKYITIYGISQGEKVTNDI